MFWQLSINIFKKAGTLGSHVYLVHVWFDQHLSYQGLSISSLVYGGVCPQTVTHYDHIGCLETLDQQAL